MHAPDLNQPRSRRTSDPVAKVVPDTPPTSFASLAGSSTHERGRRGTRLASSRRFRESALPVFDQRHHRRDTLHSAHDQQESSVGAHVVSVRHRPRAHLAAGEEPRGAAERRSVTQTRLDLPELVASREVQTIALRTPSRVIAVRRFQLPLTIAIRKPSDVDAIAGPGVDEKTLPPPDKSADGIGVFDIKTRKLLKTLSGGSDPEEFDLSKDGKLIFTSNEDTGEASVIDIAMGKVVETLKVGEEPEGVTTSPDGRFVYMTSEQDGEIFVIDTEAHKVITSFKVGNRPRSVGFFPDGKKAYVTRENDGAISILDTVKHAKAGEIKIGDPSPAGNIKPMKVILSSDATTAYVSTGRGKKIFMIDTATDKVTNSIEVGQRPWGMGLSPDGKLLYTANGPSNDVSVVDLSTNMVIKRINVGESPWGVLIVEP